MADPSDMLITRARLRAWHACYSDDRIAALIPETGVWLEDVLRLDIPAGDRVWVAARRGLLLESVLCRWLGIIVRRALGRVAEPDPRSLAVLPALDSGEWPDGAVLKDAGAVCYAASAATAASAARAAYYAAVAAAHEREQQVADLLTLLGGRRG